MSTRRSPLHLIGIAFLLLQLGGIAYARFVPERLFAWAPYDQQTRYRIEVVVDDAPLAPEVVHARYRIRPDAWNPRSIHNLFATIRQHERTYGRGERARVTVHYAVNGHPPEVWRWPAR